LNTFEYGVVRASDALSSLLLIWALPVESFSKLALAQAATAPALFLFISPESVFYRHFARWKAEGPDALFGRLGAFRRFAWGKIQLAVLLAAGFAWIRGGQEPVLERFWTLLWAFAVTLGPHASNPDREFLRLELRFKAINALTMYQKLSLLAGTVAVALLAPARLDLLAGAAVFSTLSASWLARALAVRALKRMGADGRIRVDVVPLIAASVREFSIWHHLVGAITNWIQSMDVFFLGLFRFPAAQVGLYAAALKVANLVQAPPTALASLYAVWLGRRVPDAANLHDERRRLPAATFGLALAAAAFGVAVCTLAPWLFQLLSRGRWSESGIRDALRWVRWIAGGGVLLSTALLPYTWITYRDRIEAYLKCVQLSWLALSLAVYGVAVWTWGFEGAAVSNVVVAAASLVLIVLFLRRTPGQIN
jgi:hypothetical protein